MWTTSSEIYNGYLLNLSLTGALNTLTWDGVSPYPGAVRDSFSGGTTFGVRRPSETMIISEGRGYVMPTLDTWNDTISTSWPPAYRNYWVQVFYVGQQGQYGNQPVPFPAPANFEVSTGALPHNDGMNVSYCDGHVKWLNHQQFLERCPDIVGPGEQYLPSSTVPSPSAANASSGINKGDDAQKTLKRDYPFWNLYATGS